MPIVQSRYFRRINTIRNVLAGLLRLSAANRQQPSLLDFVKLNGALGFAYCSCSIYVFMKS